MGDVELRAINLHWLEGSEPLEDCCLHGAIYLKIDDVLVSDGNDSDWTVSTAAFNLLRTIAENHAIGDRKPLIPHCGHTMWLISTEPDGLYLSGCDIGIDWEIQHVGETAIHTIGSKTVVETTLETWKTAVCSFSDEVHEFFMTSWPKIIDGNDDREGFDLFMSLWKSRRKDADDR